MKLVELGQLIPNEVCLKCDVCCRFPDKDSPYAPVFLPREGKAGRVKLKRYKDLYICPFFNPTQNQCKIYENRPLDCRIYPFILKDSRIIIDENCPFLNGFKELSLEDKEIFDDFFKNDSHPHSSRSFVNLYIWKEKNPVFWKKSKDTLEILMATGAGLLNHSSIKTFPDYIYLTKDLAELKGDKYKHKRASCNYFGEHFNPGLELNSKPGLEKYKETMKAECLKLYQKWARERKKKINDPYYHGLLGDSYSAHKIAMENFKALGLLGRVIKIKGKICAYTFGFELKKDMFCILFEVCDLKFKGISQFIFREFCRELTKYKYINTMDDSGLENLRTSKLSYHPIFRCGFVAQRF